MSYATLLQEWDELITRRPTFKDALAGYREILSAWSRWPTETVVPLAWDESNCRERWQRGVPLLAEGLPSLPAEPLEELLVPALELLAAVGTDDHTLRRVAEAWDAGEIGVHALVPTRGGIGSPALQQRLGLSSESWAFLASSLRPVWETYFTPVRGYLRDGLWDLGVCPFCGAPPGFTDITENGSRCLACHLCGGAWIFPRLRCPYCGSVDTKDFVKLQAQDREEGYMISACQKCRGYLKELDRRVRWNAGSALVEDWGSPHLDLVARRSGYWRAVPTLIELDKALSTRERP